MAVVIAAKKMAITTPYFSLALQLGSDSTCHATQVTLCLYYRSGDEELKRDIGPTHMRLMQRGDALLHNPQGLVCHVSGSLCLGQQRLRGVCLSDNSF
jgi:hypothetical protein